MVLNDAGVSNDFLDQVWGIILAIIDGENPTSYSPINWMERSLGTTGGNTFIWGEDGIEDNMFIGEHWWFSADVPMTSNDGSAGYAEGPGYFAYTLYSLLPYMRTMANFIPDWNKKLLWDTRYQTLLKWYQDILNQDGTFPSYDNSVCYPDKGSQNILGILGMNDWVSNPSSEGLKNGSYDLRGDFILAIGGGIEKKKDPYYYNENSGNIILRNETVNNQHAFQMVAEKGIAVDKEIGWGGTHEDDDMGSFMIYAGDKYGMSVPLAIDPPYTGWKPQKGANTNKYWMHNTIEIDDTRVAISRKYDNPQYKLINDGKFSNIQEFKLTFQYSSTLTSPPIVAPGWEMLSRNVKAINNSENFYYIVNDFINAEFLNNFNEVKYNLNGNGNKDVDDNSTSLVLKSYRKVGNIHRWTHPCSLDTGSWGLTAHISILNNNTAGKQSWEDIDNSDAEGIANGRLTRLQIHQPTKKTIFQSFLYPQKCNWPLPTITKEETAEHVFTKIYFINAIDTSNKVKFGKANLPNPSTSINDTASHLHFAKWQGGVADSVTNPFNLPAFTTKKLYLNAQKAFVKNNTYPLFMQGINYCPASSINIRHANFTNGSYLIYGTDTLVKATQLIDASISFATRQNYLCNIKPLATPASTDSVIFYLADVARAVDMIALIKGTQDTLPSRYDSINNKIHVKLPNVETTFFVQEKFNCVNCFFPPNWRGIDTTLNIDDKYTHTLGHKLTIKQPIGLLNITKSSKMEMCAGNYLVNKDSIIIEGPCQTKAYERKSCKGIDSMVAAYSDNSALIVSAGSALVLDSNSRTYIKNGGAIYVKQTGSLIIKSGAFVQIGDSGTCNQGWGEIIAEPGAYVHIEPGAHIEYRRVIGDTNDRNIFLIPSKNSLPIAYEGVYYYTKLILQTDSILPDSTLPFYTYPICGLDTTSPIKNKHWGYTNFAKPLATFTSRNDTLCPNEPLYIKLNRILNDAQYQIKVCRMDSIQVPSPLGGMVWQDTCIMDTIVQDSVPPDPICKEPRNTPDDWTYYFNPGTLHRVTISVWNDCGKLHDTTAFIYTSTPPDVEVNIPTTACEGINTFSASLIDHFPDAKKYTIEVTEKYDSISYSMSKGKLSKSYTKTYFGILPSTIGFDDYFFKGGSKYLISLTITNQCGSVSVYDSISIPLGVNITLTKPTVYGQSVSGATAIKLNGFTTITADSFTWNPTTWLDTATSLTPISTPLDSITYILKAYKNGCTASDTVHIKYNRFANAGYSDTLCLDSTHSTEKLIGFPYDMSLFLGMLYYYDNTQFMSYYNSHNTGNSPNYFRYFTHFMHTDNFKNSATSCPVDLYNLFTNTLQKNLFFNKSWYRGYYMQFTQFNNSSLPALATFYDQVFNTTVLKDHLDSLNNWGNIDPCINDILNLYDDYVQNHVGEITTTWSKIVNNDTTNLSTWNNFFVAENAPLKSTKYILNVITPTAAEIDEITMLVDTILTPLFAPGFQFDSTVYLVNYTQPVSNATSYEWNFGDGSANSFELNALHTFPAFDSNYVVCLTASNKCSSFMYCDTVWVDSLHLGGSLKTATKPAFFETISSTLNDRLALINKPVASSQQLVALSNYPNPFNSSTIIDYQIWQSFNQAELRITNVLGQTVFTQKLNKPIDKINIDGSLLANGIYYYTLIIDGNSIKTKSMSVVK